MKLSLLTDIDVSLSFFTLYFAKTTKKEKWILRNILPTQMPSLHQQLKNLITIAITIDNYCYFGSVLMI